MLSPAVVSELVHKCDVVFHLAAAVGVRLIVEQPVHTMVTNVQGTETVLELLQHGSASACSSPRAPRSTATTARSGRSTENDRRIYGPTTEQRWLYADSKAMDEHLALAYHLERGLDCVIVRLFNTVGPRQSGQLRDGDPALRRERARGRAARGARRRNQTRSFCHVAGHRRARSTA